MAVRMDIRDFLDESSLVPVIDVRSPGEFSRGHIPGAINIPLFDDQERAKVGTLYKHEGRHPAILEGLDIAGRKMSEMAEQARQASVNNQLLVYCWRGGMRSESMAWLFETAGIECKLLKGGYKSYRSFLRESLSFPFKIMVLGGMTGSGKTDILQSMADQGQQVVHLEKLASHKGSAFGGIGQAQQPSTESFENQLFTEIRKLNPEKLLWLEDESKTIGSVHIPDELFAQMRAAPLIRIDVAVRERVSRLVDGYACYPKKDLLQALERIRKRFGNQLFLPAKDAIESGNFRLAAELILEYYDRTYLYGLSKRNSNKVFPLSLKAFNPPDNAGKIIELAEKLIGPDKC
jgi:tRNA 2-selenouridine synthase